MNRKLFDIVYAGFSLFLMFAFGIAVAKAQQHQTQSTRLVYIPAVFNGQGYTISGRVVDLQNLPRAGVTIRTDRGQEAATDQNGNYTLSGLKNGSYKITPSQGSTAFIPVSATVGVPPNAANLNFTAQVNCAESIANGGFENNTSWEIPLTAYPAGYSNVQAHSGLRSMRTGILSAASNVYSYSDFRQAVHVPTGTAVTARFWLYTLSTEPNSLQQVESIQPTGEAFEETTLSGDLQYVLILDQDKKWIDTLVWQHSAEGYWHYYAFDLRRYAGTTIYLQFGSYNDGSGGITSMFVDDVSLNNCATTPVVCQELLSNNNFELNSSWIILDTGYHAGYSTAHYHSPSRSMRTGIANLADNTLSYSDFRQVINIPSAAQHVTLSTWLYFASTETSSIQTELIPISPTGQPFDNTTLSDDLQYLLVLDQNQNWIGTLVWQRSNSQTWTKMQFDLSTYAGKTIILQWGTFNNGSGGITSMYVDDTSVQACP